MIEFANADSEKFAIFHTVYTASNIFYRFDWNEQVDDTIDCTSDKNIIFIYDDKNLLGGFVLKENHLSYPFVAAPFDNRKVFWDIVLKYAIQASGQRKIFLSEISEVDTKEIIQSCGAILKHSKQRMIRPTEQCAIVLNDGFYFDNLLISDKTEIIKVIFEAHAAGYTSTVWEPDINEIQTAVERRFESFGRTNTLYMSNTVKTKENSEIAGVCIAGIYPDSKNYSTRNFATIHQVSVKPEYQRKGIARAMMLKSINDASPMSPVITLGVLIGNPAEKLYKKVGFTPGPSYSELIFTT